MRLRFFHVSDTHGEFPYIEGKGDFVVHSGDWFPNRHDNADPFRPGSRAGKPDREPTFQQQWLDVNAARIKRWVDGRPIIFCPGNHDYYDPTDRLSAEGITIINLAKQKHYLLDGIPFVGFPYCPANVHPWNYALEVGGMDKEIGRLDIALTASGLQGIVLVAHCPPGGILDRAGDGTHYGNPSLTRFMAEGGHDIRAVLCGHVHQDHGVAISGGVVISNAATVVHNLQIEFDVSPSSE